ncbi:MAG: hypothetical protein R6X05_18255 [Desulfobacterales bacterium]
MALFFSEPFTIWRDTIGSAFITWTWSDGTYSCNGHFSINLGRRNQNTPRYDASGDWEYDESACWNTCGEPNPSAESGTLAISQDNQRISATDELGQSWNGFIDGTTYTLVDSYAEDNGVTSVICAINLTSAEQGSGRCQWVWDRDGNSSNYCNGGFKSCCWINPLQHNFPGLPSPV